MGLGLLLLALLALLLVAAGIEDARQREIANWKNGAIAALAPAWWFAGGQAAWPGLGFQLAAAGLAFLFFYGAFHFGQMGGGDVKMIGALALWLPPFALLSMLAVMGLVGGAITLIMLIEQKLRARGRPIEVPYGVAIAIAGLLALREPLLNQLS